MKMACLRRSAITFIDAKEQKRDYITGNERKEMWEATCRDVMASSKTLGTRDHESSAKGLPEQLHAPPLARTRHHHGNGHRKVHNRLPGRSLSPGRLRHLPRATLAPVANCAEEAGPCNCQKCQICGQSPGDGRGDWHEHRVRLPIYAMLCRRLQAAGSSISFSSPPSEHGPMQWP